MSGRIPDLLAAVRDSRGALQAFEEENHEVIERWISLAGEMNQSVVAAKQAISSDAPGKKFLDYGDGFMRKELIYRDYDVDSLRQHAPSALLIPGVVKKVDWKAVQQLVADGRLSQEAADAAYRETVRVSVETPNTLQLSL